MSTTKGPAPIPVNLPFGAMAENIPSEDSRKSEAGFFSFSVAVDPDALEASKSMSEYRLA